MSGLFYDLPVLWMTVVVVAGTAVVNGIIFRTVFSLATAERRPAFKLVSPVMLTPLAVVFGLIVGFLAAQVWSDAEHANAAVTREAGALDTVVLLTTSFPGETGKRVRALVRQHIEDAVAREWPAMARQDRTLAMLTTADTEAIELILSIVPAGNAQTIAQREMIDAFRTALDARRERIIISRSKINWVKWTVVLVLGGLILATVAIVHCDNRLTAGLAMSLFSTGVVACVVLIASHNRPFTGEISVSPELLVRVMPAQ
jgi:Protein of unknown function (DUF4239)